MVKATNGLSCCHVLVLRFEHFCFVLFQDHLFELAAKFDLRFVVMADRWDRANHGTKTVEDLKERYYEVLSILNKVNLVCCRVKLLSGAHLFVY